MHEQKTRLQHVQNLKGNISYEICNLVLITDVGYFDKSIEQIQQN
jgi:hypothetical protein